MLTRMGGVPSNQYRAWSQRLPSPGIWTQRTLPMPRSSVPKTFRTGKVDMINWLPTLLAVMKREGCRAWDCGVSACTRGDPSWVALPERGTLAPLG